MTDRQWNVIAVVIAVVIAALVIWNLNGCSGASLDIAADQVDVTESGDVTVDKGAFRWSEPNEPEEVESEVECIRVEAKGGPVILCGERVKR